MMQTGRLFTGGIEHPHVRLRPGEAEGPEARHPADVLLPRPIGPTGGNMPHGQSAGYLGKTYRPVRPQRRPQRQGVQGPRPAAARLRHRRPRVAPAVAPLGDRRRRQAFESSADARLLDANFEGAFKLMSSPKAREAFDLAAEPDALRDRYGRTRFGQSCLLARRLIERGVRFVTVNMFETVFNEITWDIHGSAPFSPIECYKNAGRARTSTTPTPRCSRTSSARDARRRRWSWPSASSAGRRRSTRPAAATITRPAGPCSSPAGPIQGGHVVGASDEIGYAPKDRPVTTAEIAATVYHGLGIDLDTELPGPQSRPLRIVDHGVEPIEELF